MSNTTLINRAVIRLTGEGVRDFLQGLVTNDVMTLAADRPLWAALLSAQGKALFDFILWAEGDDVLIDCEEGRTNELVKRLSLYRLRRPITIARDETLAVHWHCGADGQGVPDPRLPTLGRRWLALADEPAEGYDARRIAFGVPEGTAELGIDKTLWLEADAVELNGVSFTKGCYVGQENTARMHHRDKLRRRLLPVRLGAESEETEIRTADGKVAGELRNRVDGIGMAWLRLEYLDGPLALSEARVDVLWPDWLTERE